MKILSFILVMSFAINATAQDEIASLLPDKTRKNEIGLLIDPGISGNDPQSNNSIQYKRWVKPDFMAYRANIGYGKYTKFDGEIVFPKIGDTAITQNSITEIPQVYAGAGVEMQKHFFKSVYMYAAIDLYAAYGSGTTKDLLRKKVVDNNDATIYEDMDIIKDYTSSNFRIGVLPFVGVKLQFSRVSFGTELSGIYMEYSSTTYSSKPSNGGMLDFSMGDFTQRIFFNYRF